MCELMGMSFNQPVSPNISFRGFCQRGDNNPNGWGIAFYPDESVQIFKEPIQAGKSPLAELIKDYSKIKSKIFISHVRKTSVGGIGYRNTHPYQRELNGREYVFAHNGTLRNYINKLTTGRFHPLGDTDSEHAFCHLLASIETETIHKWSYNEFHWLMNKLNEINNFGKFNCIFSDGNYFFCYHDRDGYNRLTFLNRNAPYGLIRLSDEDFEINLSEEKTPAQTGFIIATNPLTNERWQDVNHGELIVFKDGKMIFSSVDRDELSEPV